MIRMVGIALVILGLIAQPLVAAVPDSMPMDQSSQAPCHETAADQTAPMPCTDCDSDCALNESRYPSYSLRANCTSKGTWLPPGNSRNAFERSVL